MFFLVNSYLNPQEKEEMIRFLRANIDVFAWQSDEMPSIDAKVEEEV